MKADPRGRLGRRDGPAGQGAARTPCTAGRSRPLPRCASSSPARPRSPSRRCDALLESRHEVVAVLTRPDAPAGRGRREAASPVAAPGRRGRHRGAQAGPPRQRRTSWPGWPSSSRTAARSSPTARWCRRGLLDIPRHGWVNLHFSLLPAWRGAAPVQHAVLHGDEVTGASTFQLEEGLDTGPVLSGAHRDRPAPGHRGDLLDRLAVAGAGLLVAHPRRARGRAARRGSRSRPTASAWRPRSPSRTPGVDWSSPAVRRRPAGPGLHARRPGPGPRWAGERLSSARSCRAGETRPRRRPRCGSDAGEVLVGTGDGHAVGLGEVRPPGKRDGRRRLGPRRARPRRRDPAVTGPPRAGQQGRPRRGKRPRRTRRGGSPSTCCAPSPSATPTPT